MPYLTGLLETLPYDLPEEKPKMPSGCFFTMDGPTDTEEYKRMKAESARISAAQLAVRQQWDMIDLRDALTQQIVFLYTRSPFDTNELRRLATEVLGDADAVDRLVKEVEEAVQKRITEMLGVEGMRSVSLELLDLTPGDMEKAPTERKVDSPEAVRTSGQMEAVPAEKNPLYLRTLLFVGLSCVVGGTLFLAFRRQRPRQ